MGGVLGGFCYNLVTGDIMKHAMAQIETDDLSFEVARAAVHSLAQELQDILTQRLVAYIVGLSDGRDIGRYARQERKPHRGTDIKLRELLILFRFSKIKKILKLYKYGSKEETQN